MTATNIIIELKAVQDAVYSLPFKVNFSKLNYIGDSMAAILPFDFPMAVFRFTTSLKNRKQELFTTEELGSTLAARQLVTFTQA